MDEKPFNAATHLELIGSISALLSAEGIAHWLSGGWAVDFHLGYVSRRHSDIDLVVNLADRPKLRAVMTLKAFVDVEESPEGVIDSFDADGEIIEVIYITDVNGSMVTPGFESWPWPPDSFPTVPITFDRVTMNAVSVASLLATKSEWESQLGEGPRPHDLIDIESLQRLLSENTTAE